MRIALRTQQIVAYESGVADSIDPLGRRYYVERMTDELQAAAEAYIEKIDAMGGAVKAIEQGYIQREIAESSYQYQRQVESGRADRGGRQQVHHRGAAGQGAAAH